MIFQKFKKTISIILIVSMILQLSACNGFPGIGRVSVDSAMPYHQTRLYNQSDFYAYSEKDLNQLFKLYESDLTNYFYQNTDEKNENASENADEDFPKKLIIRNHNFTTLRDAINNYKTFNLEEKHQNYSKLAKDKNIFTLLNKYGCFKNSDISKLELNIPLESMKDEGTYYSANADFYERIHVPKDYVDKFSVNKAFVGTPSETAINSFPYSLTFDVSEDGYLSKDTKKLVIAQISTKSFISSIEDEGVTVLYTHTLDDSNDFYDLYTVEGNEITKYIGTEQIRILKGAMVGFSMTMSDLAFGIFNNSDNCLYTSIDDIYAKYKTGTSSNAVHEMYDTNIFCNRPSFDKKGYVCSLITVTLPDVEIQRERENIEVMKKIAEYNNDPLYDNIDKVAEDLANQQDYSEEELESLGRQLSEDEEKLNAQLENAKIAE